MAESYRSLVYYRAMLEDQVRTSAYQRAIAQLVKPGDVVLDLGSGLGILACFASQAGARRVYAIESTDAIVLAQQVAERNGCHNITFLNAWSTEVSLPERVDCIVTETLGGLALDENILRYLSDARHRFLKPGGRVIPQRLRLFVAAVESTDAYGHVRFWEQRPYGLHFTPVAQRASKTPYMISIGPEQLLSTPLVFREIDLSQDVPDSVEATIQMKINRSGELHGWLGWFEVELVPGVGFGTGPTDAQTHWQQVFFPCVIPMPVRSTEIVSLRLRSVPRETSLLWQWELI